MMGLRCVGTWFLRSIASIAIAVTFGQLAGPVSAQVADTNQFIRNQPLPDRSVPRRSIYGMGDDEFWSGGVFATSPRSGSFGGIWGLARDLGMSVIEWRNSLEQSAVWDNLIDSARDGEIVIAHGHPVDRIGSLREVIFYPFDSAASYYWPSVFTQPRQRPGYPLFNPFERDLWGRPLREQVYSSAVLDTPIVVASEIAYGYDSLWQPRRFPGPPFDQNHIDTWGMFFRNALDLGVAKRGLFLVVTGHLFEESSSGGPDDIILSIDILNEIPRGATWLDEHGTVQTNNGGDRRDLYTTVDVRRRDLAPSVEKGNPYIHREKAYWVDLVRHDGDRGPGGPFNEANNTHRLDLVVRWTGRAKVALRSLALRDTGMQLVAGRGTVDHSLRDRVFAATDRVMYGPSGRNTPQGEATFARRRRTLVRFYTGDEGYFTQMAGYSWLDTTLFKRYGGGDSMTGGVRAYRAQGFDNPHAHIMSSGNETPVELYNFDGFLSPDFGPRFDLPSRYTGTPSLPEHNGGRFKVPLMDLDEGDARGEVERYTLAQQRMTFGANMLQRIVWPYQRGLVAIGYGAWGARRTGRRLIIWPGVHTHLALEWKDDGDGRLRRDTTFHHIPEAAEIRTNVNLGLCYGARGVHYSWIGSSLSEYYPIRRISNDSSLYDFHCDFGSIGPFIDDTLDHYPRLLLSNTDPGYARPFQYDTIPNFYTGWGVRTREMRRLHTGWIPRIGAAMAPLAWRDGYSIHFTVPQSYMRFSTDDLRELLKTSRPLPENEVVGRVRAFDRDGVEDPPMNTFVELGLFDPRPDMADGRRLADGDSTFLFLVNRRTFERPDDIPADTERGGQLDRLAEVRRVDVDLNLGAVNGSVGCVRVTEIVPDTTRLPGRSEPRRGLDTVVHGDSAFSIVLRPGGGALLRIRRCFPDERIGQLGTPGPTPFVRGESESVPHMRDGVTAKNSIVNLARKPYRSARSPHLPSHLEQSYWKHETISIACPAGSSAPSPPVSIRCTFTANRRTPCGAWPGCRTVGIGLC